MLVEIDERRAAELIAAADSIYKLFAFAQGQEDSYAARREQWASSQDGPEEYSPFPRTLRTGSIPQEPAETVFLKFTKKELSEMPKQFSKLYKLKGGYAAHVRRKENGTYEIRYRRDGLNLSISSKNLDEAKERFIKALRNATMDADLISETPPAAAPPTFANYAREWLDVVKKPHVKKTTFDDYQIIFKAHLIPRFGHRLLCDIRPLDVQRFINDLCESDRFRMAGKVYVLLNALFSFAVAEDHIAKSPMTLIKKPRYEAKHGQALTLEEERTLVDLCLNGNFACRYAYLLMLYTGIRRSELHTVQISPEWITVVTSKTRKGASEKTRKIPVSPMLAPLLPFMTGKVLNLNDELLTRTFSKLVPGHHLHELRHTFITRCQECGISRELTSLWAGHRPDNTMTSNVYTHFSEDFQRSEAQKLRY